MPANNGRNTTPLWQVSFIDPANGITTVPVQDVNFQCPGIGSEFGVTGAPVIDPSTNRLFVLARTKQVSGSLTTYHQQLHVLDITSGAEVPGSPIEVQASVPGFGDGTRDGMVAFDPLRENNRPALLLSDGTVYIAFSSICDVHPYHGWVISYDANTLQQLYVFNTSLNGSASGIWQSGAGLAGDAQGNVYFETSNGFFDVSNGGSVYGQSVVKLTNSLAVANYFVPFNATALTEIDADLSSMGTVLLPDQPTSTPHLMIAGGKDGIVRLLNRDNMGHFRTTDDNQMEQVVLVPGNCTSEGSLWGIPAYWQNQLYVWACSDFLRTFRFYQGQLSPTSIITGTFNSAYPPPIPSVSSNGSAQGILWAIYEHPYITNDPAVLYAFDASNITRELYDSSQSGTRDTAGVAAKGPVPTVVNGKVYVATATEIDVYGLLP
ncbi:MAG: pyrrolo-quinoline quinone [Acidobacteriia bacterium]|nr:pyrrolo-quinoline quinone [Terriglobia bacterium]